MSALPSFLLPAYLNQSVGPPLEAAGNQVLNPGNPTASMLVGAAMQAAQKQQQSNPTADLGSTLLKLIPVMAIQNMGNTLAAGLAGRGGGAAVQPAMDIGSMLAMASLANGQNRSGSLGTLSRAR